MLGRVAAVVAAAAADDDGDGDDDDDDAAAVIVIVAADADADVDVDALGGSGGGLGDFPWLIAPLRPPSGTLPANSVNVFAVLAYCRRGLFSLKLSSRGRDIFIRSTRRSSSDVCITNSSNKVGFIGVVERGLSIGIVLIRINVM